LPREDTQWKKGQSGNPGGRPKGISPLRILREVLQEGGEDDARDIARNLIELAKMRDFRALGPAKEIMDRIDGAVTKRQEINLSGDKVKVVRLAGDEDDEEDEDGGSGDADDGGA
jgi:hypothetical protein